MGGSREVDDLKLTVGDLKEKLWQLRTDKDELEQQLNLKQVRDNVTGTCIKCDVIFRQVAKLDVC